MTSEQFLGEKRVETNIPNSWPWKRPKKKTYFDSADSAHLATPRGFTSESHDHDHDTFVFFGTGILGNTGLRLVVRIRSLEQLEENARQAGGIYANGIGNDDGCCFGSTNCRCHLWSLIITTCLCRIRYPDFGSGARATLECKVCVIPVNGEYIRGTPPSPSLHVHVTKADNPYPSIMHEDM